MPKGLVISIDRDYIQPIEGAIILANCDINEVKTYEKIRNVLNGRKANSVISDMVFCF